MNAKAASPGRRLREAREALGKDRSQMALETRIKVQQIKGLEEDHYDSIPAPMYVRGFIKIYAQELGLNPDPLLEQYERIRRGEPEDVPPPARRAPAPARPMDEDQVFASADSGVPNAPAPAPQSGTLRRRPPRPRPPRVPELVERWNLRSLASPRVLGVAAGVAALMILALSLRGCRGGAPEAPDPEDLPGVEHPLLHEPGPVYFNLPRSLQ